MEKQTVLIGLFHNRADPRLVSRAYLYSAIAKLEGAELFYFTPKGVNLTKRQIKGLYYHHGEWLAKTYPFPDVIINAVNFQLPWQKTIENALRKEIPFTSYPVGSKLDVYQKLAKSPVLKQHLIPYQVLKKKSDLIQFLDKHPEIVVKPIRGHHGENVMRITKDGNKYQLTKKRETETLTIDELFNEIYNPNPLQVMQKYIPSRLKTGEPFDFRIHLQKNRTGKWVISYIVPRIGNKDAVITNLSQGSQMIKYDVFMDIYFDKKSKELQAKINDFATHFGEHFDALYPYEFDELGVDVGMDENHSLWIYEVNWRPGHVFIEVFTGFNTVNYAIYLGTKKLLSERKEK